MELYSTALAAPGPCSDELEFFAEPEFPQGHDWVTSPVIQELAARLKADRRTDRECLS